MASTELSEPRINVGPEASSVYCPLEPNQIRFLTILPALCLSDEICCDLRTVALGDEAVASYEALSYTWNSMELSCRISVNNYTLMVTANLYEALRHLRGTENPRTLWVDALCINQHNMAERNVQVLLMGKIYSTVRQVIIWLGTDVEDVDAGLRVLAERAPKLSTEEIRANIGTLFERQWWYRSWVVQEFLNAQERIFVCGSITLSFNTMRLIWDAISRFNDWYMYMHIYNLLGAMNTAKSSKLRDVMLDFGHCLATDPRDKVYAYLNLAKDISTVIPDYTASIQRVYTDFAKTYIKEEGNLEIICTHHRGYNSINLPSWVPDWSICRRAVQNWTVNSQVQSIFSAGYRPGSRSGQRLPSAGLISFEDTQSLLISGILIGKVSEAARSLDPSWFDTSDWVVGLRSWKPKDVETSTYLNGESKFSAFCCTIITDSTGFLRFSGNFGMLSSLEDEVLKALSGAATSNLSRLSALLRRSTYSSRFARLSDGHFALIPNASEIGDDVCIVLGCSTPMILRKNSSYPLAGGLPKNSSSGVSVSGTYQMIGPCYVHGVMDGEMATQTSKLFEIV